ncbi:MAG: response regulator [Lachnospiraceae bacterium]
MKIILVEDEPRALRGIRNLIRSIDEDAQIIGEATDGRQALELITTLRPDVVFTDIKIPYINGIDLIRALKKYDMKTRFVLISAYEEFEYAKNALSLGVREYLVKPLTYDEAEAVLKSLKSEIDEAKNINLREISSSVIERYPQAHRLVQKAIEIVEEGYGSSLSQKTIAEKLGMTQEYFSYLFHKETGGKFSVFVRDHRIKIAEELLTKTDLSVQEVGYKSGYSDEKYFSKIFKSVVGLTPLCYRKENES